MEDQNYDEMQPQVTESLTIRFADVVITITAERDGVLQGKTNEQIIKFCADLLLRTTDETSLENQLDIITSIQETLEEKFGFNKLDATNFMTAWRKNLYRKQIGEDNPPLEDFKILRPLPVEPSSDEENNGAPVVSVDDKNMVTISIPVTKNGSKKVKEEEPSSFSIIEKDK